MRGPEFLDRKYPDLPGSKPVERAAQKVKREGEKAPHERAERIERYLERLRDIIQKPRGFGKENGDRGGLDLLKHKILEKYVTKQEEIPETYWKLQERLMRERGAGGDWESASPEQKEELKRQNSEGVLADQRSSLEQWIDEFASPDSDYIPPHLKYWVFRNILGLQEYDKEKKEYPKRSRGTIKQFPDINHEALAYVVDAIEKKYKGEVVEFEYDIQPDERAAFQKFLDKEDFAKLYAWATELYNPIPAHLLPVTKGQWRTYERGSDAAALVQSIRGKGTGWCTAGEQTAKSQLDGGDFHVFYSLDDEGMPTIPRIAIRMERDGIAEVRGVAFKQNLDPYMPDVLANKLEEFPDKDTYLKKDADMKRLTDIERRTEKGEVLDKNDLLFLYEIDSRIDGFGYQRDPRIAELRRGRNAAEDMLTIFECTKEQIAHVPGEITEHTKAYVGQLEPGIFQKIPETLEHVYTSFPEKKIRRESVEVGGKSAEQLISEMEAAGINISGYARSMLLNKKEFIPAEKADDMTLIRLTVGDLGFKTSATIDQIYERAQELGLELCPPDAAPAWRLAYRDQPLYEWIAVGMKQITVSDGSPRVFMLKCDVAGLWLGVNWAIPGFRWLPAFELVFRFRKVSSTL